MARELHAVAMADKISGPRIQISHSFPQLAEYSAVAVAIVVVVNVYVAFGAGAVCFLLQACNIYGSFSATIFLSLSSLIYYIQLSL